MDQIFAVLTGIGVLTFVLIGIFFMLLIKGASIGRREEDDVEQEKWIHQHCNREFVYKKK